MDTGDETEITVTQLGSRVNRLDGELSMVRGELGEVKTTVAGSAAMVEGLRGDMSVLFAKMDRWSEHQGSASATKGMIPVSYVTWGIGLMVSLLSVGLVVLGISASVVIWAQTSGDNQIKKDVEANSVQIKENENRHEYLMQWRDNWLVEWGQIKTEMAVLQDHDSAGIGGHDNMIHRLALLEEKLTWARQEIDDHESEADHPLMQTEAIKSIKDDIELILGELSSARKDIQRIDAEGSAVWKNSQERD